VTAAPTLALGYYWGDDDYALEAATDRLAARMGSGAVEPVERWRVRGDARSAPESSERIAQIAERVGTAPFFGGGTLVIVSEPGGLARWKKERPTVADLIASVAPGNGLAFVETLDSFGKRSVALEALSHAVGAAGGEVREIRAPKEGGMVRWIEDRAAERHVRLGRGAARELAMRVGAFVREGDVDRRRQGRLAVSELEKLALYRPGADVSVDDVRALVPEAIPGSIWALLDAIALRQTAEAVALVERLVEATPAPVMLAVIHRRIRELIQAADLVASGAAPPEVVRTLRMKPFPAEKLVKHARLWTLDELEAALDGLLDLDIAIKGVDGQVVSDGQVRLQMTLWLAEHVARGPAAVDER
jgi:DNA polymerase III delta subunit